MHHKKFISTVLASIIVVSQAGIARATDPAADAVMSPVSKGQVVPYTGVLLSPAAVATIVAETMSYPDRIKAEVDKAVATQKANCDFSAAEVQARNNADKKIAQAQADENAKRIQMLNDALKKEQQDKPNVVLWAGLGAAGGIAVTVLTAFAVVKATK